MPREGTAFWFETGNEGDHLWVVLNAPDASVPAIIVNFTDYENLRNPVIEIENNYPWLMSGKKTVKRTTVHVSGSMTVPLEKLEDLLGKMRDLDELQPALLARVRKAMYKGKCEQDVNDVLTKFYDKWIQ